MVDVDGNNHDEILFTTEGRRENADFARPILSIILVLRLRI